MPSVSTFGATSDPYLNGVLSGTKWGVNGFTFSFPASGSYYGSGYGSGEPSRGFEALNATQKAVVRDVLADYAAVANLSFTEITESSTVHADLRFAESDVPSTAWAYYPSTWAEGGDAWFNNSRNYYDNPVKGNYAYLTFVHEIGHALGLKHPHEVDGSFNAMPLERDSMEYSVMSYRSFVGQSLDSGGYTNETYGYAQSLMMYDIAALQHMYGANYTTNGGDTVYSWSPTTGEMFVNGAGQGAPGANKVFLTVWDGNGIDTYDFSTYSTNLVVDLQPGGWTTTSSAQLANLDVWDTPGGVYARGNIANALLYNNDARSLIENATGGSGNDAITGNQADNVLTGAAGNDTLDGLAGTDTAVYSGRRSDYEVSLQDGWLRVADLRSSATEGTDLARNIELFRFSDGTYTLEQMTGGTTVVDPPPDTEDQPVEPPPTDPDRTLTGTSSANVLTGGSGNDKLYGLGGNDTLIGKAGADLLDGGSGTDTASYDGAASGVVADLTSPAGNQGDAAGDTYVSIENLTGSAHADTLRGNGSANTLTGGEGADTLDGRGGNDVLRGGNGDDVLIGGAGRDTLDGGAGIDTASYATAGAYVIADLASTSNNRGDAYGDRYTSIENLTGSAFNDTLRGNGSANVLDGGAGADRLYGQGGNDTLVGGAGNDTLDGGTGTDTAVLSGNRGDYSWSRNSNGSWTIADSRAGAPDGTDTLLNLEFLAFADETVSLATVPSQSAGRTSSPGSSAGGESPLHGPEPMPLPILLTDQFRFADFRFSGTGEGSWPVDREMVKDFLDGLSGGASDAQTLLANLLDALCGGPEPGAAGHGPFGRGPFHGSADDWAA